ncbi:MAG: hypothetical protein ACRDR6_10300 [Pseudonocardiaceae bacterium]
MTNPLHEVEHLVGGAQLELRRKQNDVLFVLPETLQHEDSLSAGHLTAQPWHVDGNQSTFGQIGPSAARARYVWP